MKFFKYFLLSFSLFALSCSDTKVIEIHLETTSQTPPVSDYFTKRVLIEDYTGTWCGNCARVLYAIDQVQNVTSKTVVVGIHGGGNDPYVSPLTAILKNHFFPTDPNNYPEVRLNRTNSWTIPEDQNLNNVLDLTGNNCGLGLALNSTVANGNIDLDVYIKFAQTYSNLKLVVYIVENGIIHDQVNYTSNYQNQHPIPNFVHNHVLRSALTDPIGDNITESTALGQTIDKHFSVVVPSNVANASNISFVAFVTDSNNTVVNSRAAAANENQSFEQNP